MDDMFANLETHPSYGLVSFSRCSGGNTKLFGSSVKNPTYVELRIARCKKGTSFGSSNFYGRDRLITVKLSPAQFAELLTTMNVGSGIPCTIEQFGKERYELPEEEQHASEITNAKTYFKKSMEKFSKNLDATTDEIFEILEKKTISKSDRSQVSSAISRITQEMHSNIPFYFDCFNESAEKVLTQGKAEIDSFITTAITNIGLKHAKEAFPTIDLPTHTNILLEGEE